MHADEPTAEDEPHKEAATEVALTPANRGTAAYKCDLASPAETCPMQIRLATGDDAETVAAIYRPVVETTAISFETVAPDAQEIRHRILGTLPTYPWLVFDEGQVLGYAYASQHRIRAAYRWSVDTSVYVGETAMRRRIGLALYSSLLAILKEQRFANAYAGIALPNPASVGLHEQLGFVPVGIYRSVGYKHSRWHDVGWWQRTLDAHTADPPEPLPVAEVVHGEAGTALLSRGLGYVRPRLAV